MYDIYPKIFKLNHVKFDYNFSKIGPMVNIKDLIKKLEVKSQSFYVLQIQIVRLELL